MNIEYFPKPVKMSLNKNDLNRYVGILEKMLTIRIFEEKCAEILTDNKLKTPCHLYIGQEGIASAICSALNKEDYVFSTHRSHGHYLAKTMDVEGLMNELFCHSDGCSGGRGGSMHLCAPEYGILGTSSIVGGGIGISIGPALASSLNNDGKITVVFHGDGAMEEGIWYEAANLAAIWNLPIVFVCENNFYSTHMPICARRRENVSLSEISKSLGLDVVQADGNNPEDVYQKASVAITRAREGNGPSFFECFTWRWLGHVGPHHDIDKGLRTQEELDAWKAQCPIKRLREALFELNMLSESKYLEMENNIKERIQLALINAEKGSYPHSASLYQNVYAGEPI